MGHLAGSLVAASAMRRSVPAVAALRSAGLRAFQPLEHSAALDLHSRFVPGHCSVSAPQFLAWRRIIQFQMESQVVRLFRRPKLAQDSQGMTAGKTAW